MLSSADKTEALRKLGRKRQQWHIEPYCCLHEFASRKYECDHVSPWSKTCNVDSQIMVVAQDWASENQLRGPINDDRVRLGYDRAKPTNKNLQQLLKRHFNLQFSDVYATNAFPFIKPGGMQGRIDRVSMERAVKAFLLPQIEIVEPKFVICLGKSVFNAVRATQSLEACKSLDEAMRSTFEVGGASIHVAAHTGARGTNSRGPLRVEEDWARLSEEFSRL